jgi:hypothetical protein
MKSEIIKRVCNIPLNFKNVNKSPFTLAQESGILEIKELVSVEDFKFYLENNRDLLQAWQMWSENKRTTFGYFLFLKSSSSVVAAMDSKGNFIFRKSFANEIDAAAEYILREVFGILGKKFKYTN